MVESRLSAAETAGEVQAESAGRIAGKSDKRRVTLRDVAKESGVSLKTASNVINHTGRMTDATREKVQEIIDRLGYRVNVAARNLNRGKTGFITLAVPSLTAPYLAEFANRVIDTARMYDYSVYVTTFAEGTSRGTASLLSSFNTTVSDGIILSLSEVEDLTSEDLSVEYPLVCVGARFTHNKVDRITPNDVQSARLAAEYLLDRGVRRPAVIGARTDFAQVPALREAREGNAQLRMRGVIEACDDRGIALVAELMPNVGHDWSIGSGARNMQRVIDSGKPFDGVIALNDQLAMGALSTLAANGIAVPDQVQVIGFDNNEESAYFQPPLTTMDSCLDWLAPTAVSRIIDRIGGNRVLTPELITTQSRVIARATTRA